MVTVNLKEILLIILLVALIVMVIYACIMLANLIKSLKKINLVLDDSKVVTEVVAKKSTQIDNIIDEVNEAALEVVGIVKGNSSTVSKVKGVVQGATSVKKTFDKFKKDENTAYVKRKKKEKK